MPNILTSIRGQRVGLDEFGRLVAQPNVPMGSTEPSLVGRLLYVNTAASTAITNSTAETAFSTSHTIPANSLLAGTVLKIRYQGIATATNSTDTLTVRLRIGGLTGTVLHAHTATDVANNDVWQGWYDVVIRTVGASGTMVGFGARKNAPAAEGTATWQDDILASTTIDTTAAQTINVTGQWSVANAGNSCRLDVMMVEAY